MKHTYTNVHGEWEVEKGKEYDITVIESDTGEASPWWNGKVVGWTSTTVIFEFEDGTYTEEFEKDDLIIEEEF